MTMATHNADLIDGVASESISKGQFVKYASGGWDACDSAGEMAHGIAFNDASANEGLTVQVGKLCLCKVGSGGISDGDDVTTDANGLAATATAGDYVRGKAIGAGAAGAYATILWFDGYVFDGT
jgi:hypothetical protein